MQVQLLSLLLSHYIFPNSHAFIVVQLNILVSQVDSSYAFTEMTVQYLLELEWTARTVLSNLNRRLSLPHLPAG